MPTESADYIGQLEPSRPLGTEPVSEGDDHFRLIKKTLGNTFVYNTIVDREAVDKTGFLGPLTYSLEELNLLAVNITADADGLLIPDQDGNRDKQYLEMFEDGKVSLQQPLTPLGTVMQSVLNETELSNVYGANVFTLCDGKDIVPLAVGTETESRLSIVSSVTEAPNLQPEIGTSTSDIGLIVALGAVNPPDGYLRCDGTPVLRTEYADLYSVIGNSFGSGDGINTFHTPDLRGRFLRGRDNAQGRDPDSGARTAMNTGGSVGDNIGSLQVDQFASHLHSAVGAPTGNEYEGGSERQAMSAFNGNTNVSSTGGSETRPKNAYVDYFIKYLASPSSLLDNFLRIN